MRFAFIIILAISKVLMEDTEGESTIESRRGRDYRADSLHGSATFLTAGILLKTNHNTPDSQFDV